MSQFETRRDRLRKRLRKEGLEALLVTSFQNVTYLTGFTGDDSYLLLGRDAEFILSDARYTQQLGEECPGLDVAVRKPGIKMGSFLVTTLNKAKLGNLAIESGSMSVQLYAFLLKELRRVTLQPTDGLVESLREIKDKGEIAEIRMAIDVAERAFAVVRASLRGERTEREIAHAIEHEIRLFGGHGCSFEPIVAVGPRAALPHARPGWDRICDSDFVLIDWGAQGRLYMSDLTRVLVTGKIPPKLERIYGVVLKAQLAAIGAIRPGAVMEEVDAVARGVIADAGFGKRFGHGLGHGIGLQIHEAPRLAENEKRPLKPGMVLTVEPGIYIPNWGGVRIEDDVLVTRDGCEVLTSVAKDFADCIVS